MTIFGDGDFTEVKMRSAGRVPIPNDWCPFKRRTGRPQIHTEGRSCEDTGRRGPSSTKERPKKKPTLPIPSSQTSSLQLCEN